VFLGDPSARVRDELWLKGIKRAKDSGAILQVWTDKNAQGFSYRQFGARERKLADFEGLALVKVQRPES
jgi:CRISPR-associated protein Cas2